MRRLLLFLFASLPSTSAAANDVDPLVGLVHSLNTAADEDLVDALREVARLAAAEPPLTKARLGTAVRPLVRLLDDVTELRQDVGELAAMALTALSSGSPDNKAAIVAEGGIVPLARLVSQGSSSQGKEWAAGALANVASSDVKAHATSGAIVRSGPLIREAGAIAPLVAMLREGSAGAVEKAAVALGAIAHGDKESKDAMAEAGAVAPLVSILTSCGADSTAATNMTASKAAAALWAVVDGHGVNRAAAVSAGAVDALVPLLARTDDGKKQAAGALASLVPDAAAVVPHLLSDLTPERGAGSVGEWAALRVATSLQAGEPGWEAEDIVASGALPALEALMQSGLARSNADSAAREAAASALALVAGSSAEAQAACAEVVRLPQLVLLLMGSTNKKHVGGSRGSERAVVAQLVWNLAADVGGGGGGGEADPTHLRRIEMVRQGAIKPLTALLSDHSPEARMSGAGALGALALSPQAEVTIGSHRGGEAIRALAKALADPEPKVRHRATGAMLNLASQTENRKRILQAGAVRTLVKLLGDGAARTRSLAAAALWSLVDPLRPDNRRAIVAAEPVDALVRLLGDEAARANADGALEAISRHDKAVQQAVLESKRRQGRDFAGGYETSPSKVRSGKDEL